LVTRPVQYLKKKNNIIWKALGKVKSLLGYNGYSAQTDADDLEHLQFFTIPKLRSLADQNLFKIVEIGRSNFIEDVFPVSLLSRRIKPLQKWDCQIADRLPAALSGGFNMVWKKSVKVIQVAS